MKNFFKALVLGFFLSSPALAQSVSSLPTAASFGCNDLFYLVKSPITTASSYNITGCSVEASIFGVISGSITINSAGVSTIGSGVVTSSMLASGINANLIANGSVSNTAFQYVANVTSDIQAQINAISSNNNITTVAYGSTTTLTNANYDVEVAGGSGATLINLPNAAISTVYIISDQSMLSSSNNITVDSGAGNMINGSVGARTYVMNQNGQVLTLKKVAANTWKIQ